VAGARQRPDTVSADNGAEGMTVASAQPDGEPPAGPDPDDGAPAENAAHLDDGAPDERRSRRASLLRELAVIVVAALLISSLVKGYAVQTFFIPSGSMETTLHGCPGCHGDRVLVNKFVYRIRDVHRGEVVVFRGTSDWPDEESAPSAGGPLLAVLDGLGRLMGAPPTGNDFIKRVIAIPGDTIRCCDPRGRVSVNGVPLDEPYVFQDNRRTFGPITLKPGQLWVMGDHRGDSSDSRDHGPIPADHVVGRGFAVIWPLHRWKSLPVPATFGQPALNRKH